MSSQRRLADRSIRALAVMRVTIGALAWVRPDLTERLFGMRSGESPYLWRLFGIRDVAIGLGTLAVVWGAAQDMGQVRPAM